MIRVLYPAMGLVVAAGFRLPRSTGNSTAQPIDVSTIVQNEAGTEGEWDDFSDAVGGGLGAIEAGIGFGTDPTLKNAAGFLGSVGALAPVLVPPPAGIVIGGVMGLVGGLAGIFFGDSGPSNQDILDKMAEGFNRIGAQLGEIGQKLDDMDKKLTRMEDALNRVESTLKSVANLLGEQYKETIFAPYYTIQDSYAAATKRLQDAARFPDDADYQMCRFWTYVRGRVIDIEGLANRFNTANVTDKLDVIQRYSIGGSKCVVSTILRDIIASRFQLGWLLYMGNLFKTQAGNECPLAELNPSASRYLEDVAIDVRALDTAIRSRYSIDETQLGLTAEEIAKLDALKYKAIPWDSYWVSYLHQPYSRFVQEGVYDPRPPHPPWIQTLNFDFEEKGYVKNSRTTSGTGPACNSFTDEEYVNDQQNRRVRIRSTTSTDPQRINGECILLQASFDIRDDAARRDAIWSQCRNKISLNALSCQYAEFRESVCYF